MAASSQQTQLHAANAYLRCSNLCKYYENVTALNSLTYQTSSNALGLFGPNGSGKSTFINTMMGLVKPSNGFIQLRINRRNLRFVPDFPKLPGNYTVDKWLETLEGLFGPIKLEVDIQEETELDGAMKLKNLSAGQYRLAALLPVFHGDPELIILDEPTNFLDLIKRNSINSLIKEQVIRSRSKIILASHRMEEILAFSENVLILNKGEMVAETSLSLEDRELYSIRLSDTTAFTEMLKSNGIDYQIGKNILGEHVLTKMSWAFWKVLHRFTKDGGVIYALNIVNDFETKLSEF